MNKKTRRRENDPTIRREEILNVAIELATRIGYQNITRDEIATLANTSSGLIALYFSNMDHLKKEVLKTAIQREILIIIAQGLSLGDIQTSKIDQELKNKTAEFLSK